MKIAVPVDENTAGAAVCASFGRAPYFLIYDTEDRQTRFIENTAAGAQGGAGIRAAQIVADSGAQALVTVRCGENAAQVLKAAGVKIFRASSAGAADSLRDFEEGKPEPLEKFHAGFHGRP